MADEGSINSVPWAESPFLNLKLGFMPSPRKPEVDVELEAEADIPPCDGDLAFDPSASRLRQQSRWCKTGHRESPKTESHRPEQSSRFEYWQACSTRVRERERGQGEGGLGPGPPGGLNPGRRKKEERERERGRERVAILAQAPSGSRGRWPLCPLHPDSTSFGAASSKPGSCLFSLRHSPSGTIPGPRLRWVCAERTHRCRPRVRRERSSSASSPGPSSFSQRCTTTPSARSQRHGSTERQPRRRGNPLCRNLQLQRNCDWRRRQQ